MLTQYLLTLQDHLHLSDADFAHELGLEDATWQALRDRRAPYSPEILAKLLCHVPNAHALALEEYRHDHQDLTATITVLDSLDGTVPTPAPVPTQEPAPLAYAA